MAGVTGFGGAFLRASDPDALYAWYESALGLQRSGGSFLFEVEGQRGPVALAFFARTEEYFPAHQPVMLNFQVDDLDAMLKVLQSAGAVVDSKREDHEYGRFGWFNDPEGNRVELWEPAKSGKAGA
jgi:predicted enzyme related to lactoylglutathione lyase